MALALDIVDVWTALIKVWVVLAFGIILLGLLR